MIPVYSPFQRGEPIPFGGLWTIDVRFVVGGLFSRGLPPS